MRTRYWRKSLAMLAVLSLMSISGITSATDFRLSGFGTIGYARSSESDLTYLRYIDRNGTFKTDSLVGIQAEAQFNAQWGATVQAVASAPRTRDEGYEAKFRWAFLSFRPDNDWLIRVGRVRPTFFFNTQNAEVGVTFDQARLPVEVYSISPVYDIDGVALSKSWVRTDSEINLDAHWGKADVKFRDHFQIDPPARYFSEKITFKGLVLTFGTGPILLKAGVHHANLEATGTDQYPQAYAPTPIPAPLPFGGTIYLPTGLRPEISVRALTLGVDWRLESWRVTAEYGQRNSPDSDVVVNDWGAYLTVARRFNRWTPYLTYARMLSKNGIRDSFAQVNDAPVPLAVQGPPEFVPANFHRLLADRIAAYDQHSTMLGTSYSISATSKLKFEWMRTHVGLVSAYVDGNVHNRSFNVYSASYSVAF